MQCSGGNNWIVNDRKETISLTLLTNGQLHYISGAGSPHIINWEYIDRHIGIINLYLLLKIKQHFSTKKFGIMTLQFWQVMKEVSLSLSKLSS